MTSKLTLVTYATDEFQIHAEGLRDSARRSDFDEALIYGPKDIVGTNFYADNSAVLNQTKGGGYWLWKPYIIGTVLRSIAPNDAILYCDAGRNAYYQFTRRPARLEAMLRTVDKGFLLGPCVPHLGTIRDWTKRDCLSLMKADNEDILCQPLIMTWGLWRPTPEAFGFLNRWLQFCIDPRCITDMPNTLGLSNHLEFRDHRHDQSILSILALQEQAPYLDFSHTLVQRAIKLRPNSLLGHQFYKRPENADILLGLDNPLMLVREYLRSRKTAIDAKV